MIFGAKLSDTEFSEVYGAVLRAGTPLAGADVVALEDQPAAWAVASSAPCRDRNPVPRGHEGD